ncbi:hypothetical protein [Giesbergeria anulus]|uniref:Uncharacterized protein n=1 Tax=Giesbergeria anulus TaxID=180197 RepID=A0A1H9NRG8_9BURK|nr:hypothetical protein [Giesbergeria anulus]SER37933.1 hypothetical protein SAMN02982919_02297 [Giesbergeria anulus]
MQPNPPQTVPLPSAEDILKSGETSRWLKNALSKALDRDPLDALTDAEFLLGVLDKTPEALPLPCAKDVLAAPAGYSYWLVDRLKEGSRRDHLDLVMDVQILIGVLQHRIEKVLHPQIH